MKTRVVALMAGLALGCGGTPSGGTPSGDLGNPPTGGMTADSGTSLSPLIGTWDVSGSGWTATVVVLEQGVQVTLSDGSVSVVQSGAELTANVVSSGSGDGLTATRVGAPFSTGILPFELGGSWSLQIGSPPQLCAAQVEVGHLSSTCASGQPWQSIDIARSQSGTSVLGDLGGTWAWVTTDQSGRQSTVDVELAGETGTLRWIGADGGAASTLTVLVGDGIVSGTSHDGSDFSATRR